jgi:carboxymethylenebutenolidase
MSTRWIKIKSHEGREYEALVALPPTGKGSGIVLFQEIFGVNHHIRAVAEQYMLDGYVVLAPDVFWRQEPHVQLHYSEQDFQHGFKLMQGSKPEDLAADVKSSVAALRALPEVTGKVGALGFCMGGRLAYLAAATAGVDAAVCYYGGGIQDSLDVAKGVRGAIQFHYGALDKHIPREAVDKVRAAFAGKTAEFHVYENADHGFNCWERGSYHQRSAAMAHGRSLSFFAQHL